MGLGVPTLRKPRGADALVRSVHDVWGPRPDPRKGEAHLPWPAALLSACALVPRTAPSCLALEHAQTADHVPRVYGLGQVPFLGEVF